MDWSDVLKLALSIFLVVTGLGLAYLFLRMAGVFSRLGVSVTRVTDEVVPILNKAQTTVDGINLEISRVDDIMKTAVGATKGAEKTVQTVSSAVTAPVRKIHGFAAGAREAVASLRARRASDAALAAERNAAEARNAAAVAAERAAEAAAAVPGGRRPAAARRGPPAGRGPAARRAAARRPARGRTAAAREPLLMGRLIKLGVAVGVVGWLHSIGALDPRLWKDTIAREREQIPQQVKEALAAGKRAAAQAEDDLDRQVREAFDSRG